MRRLILLGLAAALLAAAPAYAAPVLVTAPLFAGVGQNILCRVQNVSTVSQTVTIEALSNTGAVQNGSTVTLTPGLETFIASATDGSARSCRFSGASAKRIRAAAEIPNGPGQATSVVVEAH